MTQWSLPVIVGAPTNQWPTLFEMMSMHEKRNSIIYVHVCGVSVLVQVCVCVCVCVRTHMHACMHVCMYVCVCVYVYIITSN